MKPLNELLQKAGITEAEARRAFRADPSTIVEDDSPDFLPGIPKSSPFVVLLRKQLAELEANPEVPSHLRASLASFLAGEIDLLSIADEFGHHADPADPAQHMPMTGRTVKNMNGNAT